MAPSQSDDSIVVLANHTPACVVSLRSLGRRGISTIAVGEDDSSPAFSSRYCKEAVTSPSPHDSLLAYRDALEAIASIPGVRSIMPFREEDVYVLSKYRDRFDPHVSILWPEFETLRRAHDRIRLVEAAMEIGIPVPETQLLDEVADWDRELIVKARYALLAGEYAEGLSAEDVITMGKTKYLTPGVAPDQEAIRAEMGHTPIVQEYIPGTEYTFRALYDHGQAVITSQKRLVRGQKYPRGPSVYHEAVEIPRLKERGTALLDHLDWHGVASVGFMQDSRTGEFNLLEINPRFWASLPLDIHAGIDYPYYYWRLAGGDSLSVEPEYRVGRSSHYLLGEVSHLNSILRDSNPFVKRPSAHGALRDIVSSIFEQPQFDCFSLDDPWPFLREVRNTVSAPR